MNKSTPKTIKRIFLRLEGRDFYTRRWGRVCSNEDSKIFFLGRDWARGLRRAITFHPYLSQ